MKTPAYKSSLNNSWLNIAEIIAVAGSIGGAIASIFLQKYLYASLPLSASVALNLLNRQRMTHSITSTESRIEQLEQQSQQSEFLLSELSQKVEQKKEMNSSELSGRLEADETKLSKISQEMQKIRQHLLQVNNLNQNLDKSFNSLNKQQIEINKLIKELRVSEDQSQTVLSVGDPAEFCFNLALVSQKEGDRDRAMENYIKAVEINPDFTLAYYNLGLIYMEIGDNRKAIDNLRKASQLYFKQNNLEKYQELRNLSLQLYSKEKEGNTSVRANEDKIAAYNLFE